MVPAWPVIAALRFCRMFHEQIEQAVGIEYGSAFYKIGKGFPNGLKRLAIILMTGDRFPLIKSGIGKFRFVTQDNFVAGFPIAGEDVLCCAFQIPNNSKNRNMNVAARWQDTSRRAKSQVPKNQSDGPAQ